MNDIERRTLIGAAGIGAIAALSKAGPLDPPAGPATSTGKTTQELFDKVAAVEARTAINAANTPGDATSLFRITQPGSYYLAGNTTGVAGKNGVSIEVSGVTLDLNGFDLVGVAGANTGVRAAVSNLTDIAVLNGSVRGWGTGGVNLSLATNCCVEGVLASGNASNGIYIGSGSSVTNCSATGNSGGFQVVGGSTVAHCSAYANNVGIVALSGSTVANCAVNDNLDNGIKCFDACVVRDNTCSRNGGSGTTAAGIAVFGNDNRIAGNSVTYNPFGILLNAGVSGNIVVSNHASRNRGSTAYNYSYPASGNFIGTEITSSAGMNAASNALVNTSY